ncbi:Ig-like domain-containing protein [Paenibacillus sp. GD4]|uniref:Ig-like domain-containing protein n=1 Tax=Paenibacillus sp. GD4 TaxID=3068890 RepID=UPI002796A2C3|nr:Ig-like domain-containing protein [Paenibacillus sp. GD4]MDQ1914102.1 Ig-like domain-containing protein [Paenibacillus sp. GD4]
MYSLFTKSRFVCVFLVFTLMLGSLMPFAASSVFASAGGDLLADTFDTATLGQRPTGWSGNPPAAVEPAPNPYVAKAVVEELQGHPGRLLHMQKNAKSVSTYQIERKLATSATAKSVLTYQVRPEQGDAVIYLPSPKSGTVVLAKFAFNNGHFAYMKKGASAWTNITPYSGGVWYDVKLALNAETDTFDLYINGELKLAQEPMAEGEALTSFYLGIYKDSIGRVYFDELHAYSYKPALGASFQEAGYSVAAGASLPLTLVYNPVDATNQTAAWTSDNPAVATVNSSGVVTGIKPGTAVITAVPVEDLPPVSTTVTVYEVPVTGISLAPVTSSVPAGSRVFLQATVAPDNSTNKKLTWGTYDPQVAAVDQYGELTGVGAGTTKVYALSADGSVRGETTVTVTARSIQHQLYVSLNGQDTNPGTIEAPFRTISRAKTAVRGLNAAMTGDIVVNLREGTYTLQDTLQFDPNDSGKNGHFVTYRSYPGEQAVISGGRAVTGWVEHDPAKGIYKAAVGPGFQTRQLFVDGVRAIRARSEGGLTNPVKTANGYTSDDTFLAGWRNPADLEFVFNEIWTNPRAGVASISAADGKAVITMEEPGWTAVANKGMTSATVPVHYENAYELLDQAGEWYLDSAEGMLYYKPRAWEQLSNAAVIAPVLEKLITIQGISADQPVRNVQFEGLHFMYTTWMRPSTSLGHADAQNNYLRYPGTPDELADAAIMIQLANSVNFERNHFAKLGITALRMDNGVQNSLVRGNEFYDISGGAINVGSPNSNDREVFNPADHRKVMKNNDIVNNLIHDIGVDYKSAAAISAGYPEDMDISHNEIYNIPYSGTHIGYGWAKAFDPITRNVKIQNNLIYDLMGMGLRDGGAIYSLGVTGATPENKNLVSGNYIRNQMDANGALYADEASAYWRYENNVIDLKESPPWHSPKRWALVWTQTIHDLDFYNNYTTGEAYTNSGVNVTFENTHSYPDANWPGEARAIIDNAGLQPEYRFLAEGKVSRWSSEAVNIAVGGSAAMKLFSKNGKDQTVTQEQSRIYYSTANPSIAVVDEQGAVKGVSVGSTKVRAHIVNGSLLRTVEADVFVGDTLAEIRLDDQVGKVVYVEEGTSVSLSGYGSTAFGNKIGLDSITYRSSEPSIASVAEGGILTAHQAGSTVLTMEADFLGNRTVSHVLLKVWNHESSSGYAMRYEFDDADNWYVSSTGNGTKQATGGQITVGTPGGHAIYQGRTYRNELLDFNLKINGTGSWYALMFGNQDKEKGYSNGSSYLVTISSGALELQRFNEGARTVIYGNIAGHTSIGGDAVPNTMLPLGEEHRVQLGSFEEAGGVRLIMKVDGNEVFNFLDTTAKALKGPGYFGLVSRTGSMTLGPSVQGPAPVVGIAIEGLSGELKAGEVRTSVAKAVYDNGFSGLVHNVVWISSQPETLSVDPGGVVTALRPGSAILSASYGAVQGTYPVTVLPSPDRKAPVTTDNAPESWSASDVTVQLQATDEESGVAATYYTVNDGQPVAGTAVKLTEEGIHTLRYWSVDKAGNQETVHTKLVRIDKTAPTLQVTLSESVLFPANHRMVSVTASTYAQDRFTSDVKVTLLSVVSNEPDEGLGDGDTAGDIQGAEAGTADLEFLLRAERSGKGPGRMYTVTYLASDEAGNHTTASAIVTVPHSSSGKK